MLRCANQVPTRFGLCKRRILIEEEEVRSKVLWHGMQLVEPWENEEVSDDLFTINPTFLPRDRLSSAQQTVTAPAPCLAIAAVGLHLQHGQLYIRIFDICFF